MAKTQTRLVQVHEHPAVTAAKASVDALARERRTMEEARAEAWQVVSPNSTRSASEEARLRARLTLDGSDDALRLHRLKEIAAEQAMAAATDQARRELAAAGHAALRPAVAALASALAAAADANTRVTAIENELNVLPDLRLGWRELLPSTPMAGSRLEAWQSYARAAGLLD